MTAKDAGEIRIVESSHPTTRASATGGWPRTQVSLGLVLEHHSAFKRIAVVSDKEWIAHAVHATAWMVPGELAVFGLDELEQAKEWAAGG